MRKLTGILSRSAAFLVFIGFALFSKGQAPIDPLTLSQSSSGITFEHGTFGDACAKAKASGKLIFLDFWATWCGPCMYMSNVVFKEKEVGEYFNSHFINLKAECGKREWKELYAKYQVKNLPVFMFMDCNGAVYMMKAHDWAQGPVLLQWAETALQEFSDPQSLPRLNADYASKKDDTAFLRKYLDKRIRNAISSYDILDQYLSIQTAIPAGSPAMLDLLLAYRSEWYYGGKAAAILEKQEGNFRRMADSSQLEKLNEGKADMCSKTLVYARESKNERLVKLYIIEQQKLNDSAAKQVDPSPFPRDRIDHTTFREDTWLEYYTTVGDWLHYRKLADVALDRIGGLLKPDPTADRDRDYGRFETWEEIHAKGMASIMSRNARVYWNQFRSEPGVAEKVLRWMKMAVAVYPCDPDILSRYANVLYEHQDTAEAIRIKKRALKNILEGIGAPRVQANLEHMQKGEPLEEETNINL